MTKQMQVIKDLLNNLGVTLKIESTARGYLGYYNPNAKVLCLIDNDGAHQAAMYHNEVLYYNHSLVKTLAHELTHHFQFIDSKYNDIHTLGYIAGDAIHKNGIYAYNEIVANTVAMYIINTEDVIKDNLQYTYSYIQRVKSTSRKTNHDAFYDRLNNNLNDDVNKYYNIIHDLFTLHGLI